VPLDLHVGVIPCAYEEHVPVDQAWGEAHQVVLIHRDPTLEDLLRRRPRSQPPRAPRYRHLVEDRVDHAAICGVLPILAHELTVVRARDGEDSPDVRVSSSVGQGHPAAIAPASEDDPIRGDGEVIGLLQEPPCRGDVQLCGLEAREALALEGAGVIEGQGVVAAFGEARPETQHVFGVPWTALEEQHRRAP